MSFIDENCGFILSYDGLYKTTNGGESWKKIFDNKVVINNNVITKAFNKIKFYDYENGYMYTNNFLGYCLFVKISGIGNSYSIIRSQIKNQSAFNFVNKLDAIPNNSNLTILLGFNQLLTIDNSGDLLNVVNDSLRFDEINCISEDLFVASFGNTLYKSTNGGISWSGIVSLSNKCVLLKCFENDVMFYSDRNNIFKSCNGGKSFLKMDNPFGEINQMCFPSEKVGFAVGSNGKILKFIDEN
jgi:photosystem II stability/assembly factor-like uncharacterized protein